MTLPDFITKLETQTQHKATRTATGYAARCPAHEDRKPSLSISEGSGGRILVKCQAGCATEAVTGALGLRLADLFVNGKGKKTSAGRGSRGNIVATYDYRDAGGKLLFQSVRFDPKDFRQRRPDKSALDGWTWNLKGVRPVLYRLPELLAAVKAGETVFIAEGEKDVESLVKHNFAATCNAGGAGKWRADYRELFAGGKAVVIIADKDEPGRNHAIAVAKILCGVVLSAKVLELPDVNGKPVKDAADFFAAGGTAEQLRELVRTVPEFAAQAAAAEAINPNTWFKKQFPMLAEMNGEPVALRTPINGRPSVQDLNESFLAATLGQEANPKAPTVFIRQEARFYSYRPEQGIFGITSEDELSARLSDSLLACARDCRESCDVSALEFQHRDTAALAGVVKRARAAVAAPDDFFASNALDFLPVANGMLRLEDRVLLPFGPEHRRRNKLAVPYVAGARCPLFEDTLLGNQLSNEDAGLLQRWTGLALCGRNVAQRILILSGTAGAGKGTFIRVLKGVIGEANIGSLRTDKLNERFEIGRLLNKTLLYGADVPANFLNMGSASVLKSLTGGDPMTVEFKGSMDSPSLTCAFNVIVTSNSRLTVHLEGDVDAWQRRLAIISYERAKPANVIFDLDERILTKEGPGVLNWMLDGLYALRIANWQLTLHPRQQYRVDELLQESDSVNVFFTERCVADSLAPGVTVSETFGAYADFCMNRGWNPVDRYRFGREAPDMVQRIFRLVTRHDIKGTDGKSQRGWKTLRLRAEDETDPEAPN